MCAGTPNNASMVSVYAPAWTTAVVCAGAPHNMLRVTIHAPASTKVVLYVGTPSVIICDVYRRRTRVSRRPKCCAPARDVFCDTHASFPCGERKGGTRRHAGAGDEACTGIHVTQLLLHNINSARHRMSRNISWVCTIGHVHAYWNNGRGGSVWFVIPICGMYRE